jgi:hypothetical protein
MSSSWLQMVKNDYDKKTSVSYGTIDSKEKLEFYAKNATQLIDEKLQQFEELMTSYERAELTKENEEKLAELQKEIKYADQFIDSVKTHVDHMANT